MYLAYLYVSYLDLVLDGIKASLDVLGSFCEIWIPSPRQLLQYCHKRYSLDQCTRYYTYIGYELLHPDSGLLQLLLPKQLCTPLHT